MSPPPPSVVLSLRMVEWSGMSGVGSFGFNLVSYIVTILGLVVVMSWVSSIVLLRIPFVLSCMILKSLGPVVACL